MNIYYLFIYKRSQVSSELNEYIIKMQLIAHGKIETKATWHNTTQHGKKREEWETFIEIAMMYSSRTNIFNITINYWFWVLSLLHKLYIVGQIEVLLVLKLNKKLKKKRVMKTAYRDCHSIQYHFNRNWNVC